MTTFFRMLLLTVLLAPTAALAEDMTMSAAMQKLARQGAEQVVQMNRREGLFRAVVRREDGSHAVIAIDPASGRISAAEERDLLRNSLDSQFVTQWLRVFTDDVAPEIRPAHDVVRGLMATGKFRDLHSLKFTGKAYQVEMVGQDGNLVSLDVDGQTTAVAEKSGV